MDLVIVESPADLWSSHLGHVSPRAFPYRKFASARTLSLAGG
jgi:hypothetical protein